MVEILGFGVNVESILGSVGQSIYETANNVVSTLINVARDLANKIYEWIKIAYATFVEWFKKALNWVFDLFKRYVNWGMQNPLEFTIATTNLIILFGHELS